MRIAEYLRALDLRTYRRITGWRLWHARIRREPAPTVAEIAIPRISNAANRSGLWVAMALALAWLGGRSGKRAAIRGVGSVAATSVLVNVLVKPIARRARPRLQGVPAVRRLRRQPTSPSFPSGHAASAAAFAVAVAAERPKTGAALAPLAATVAYSRVFVGVHYPSDVLAGLAIGASVALASRRAWPRLPSPVERPTGRPAQLDPRPDGQGIVLVVNPDSGPRIGGLDPEELEKRLPQARVVRLRNGADPREVMADALGDAEVLGVSGGDGTLAAAAEVALDAGLPLLVLPGGTMNHFARDLGIDSADAALTALRKGEALEVDVGQAGDRAFLSNASFGAYTRMVEDRHRLQPRVGRWAAQGLALLRAFRSQPVEVRIDGRPRKIWTAFVGNCGYHSRGIAPGWRHSTCDGVLDVRIVGAERHSSRLQALAALVAGRTSRSGAIERLSVSSIRLEPVSAPLRIIADGEPLDELDGPVEIRKAATPLRVYAPVA